MDHHLGSTFTRTNRNGPNNRIRQDCAGRACCKSWSVHVIGILFLFMHLGDLFVKLLYNEKEEEKGKKRRGLKKKKNIPSRQYSISFCSCKNIIKSRKETPQQLTQLSSRSHPRHLVGKRTAQKDITIDTTSDSQVNSNFPNKPNIFILAFKYNLWKIMLNLKCTREE